MARDQDRDSSKQPAEIEIEPGAWERFEQAVDRALHTKPKPQSEVKVGKARKARSPASKGR